MISVYIIISGLATIALAKGYIECNFAEPTGSLCFGAVGQLLFFHLPDTDIRLYKYADLILTAKNKKGRLYGKYLSESELFTNGTFKLGNATKRHSGDYMLEEFQPNGTSLKKVNVHLELLAPVSEPVASQMCLSSEQMNITCCSGGDEVEFSLTLNGNLLMQTRGPSQSKNNWPSIQPLASSETKDKSCVHFTISLYGQLTGPLTCSVWNNVSKDDTVVYLTGCKGFSFSPVVIVTVTASAVALVLSVVLCFGLRNLHHKRRTTSVNESNIEDEVIYSDVRGIQKSSTENPLQNET